MDAPTTPSLHVCPGDSFLVPPTDPARIRNSPLGLSSDYYRRLLIFDGSGRTWRVEDVRTDRGVTFLDRLLRKTLNARLVCRAAPDVEMQQVVDELCSIVDSDSDDLYNQFVSHNELKRLFRSARSPGELIEVARRLGDAG
jgi:hypothetical protein